MTDVNVEVTDDQSTDEPHVEVEADQSFKIGELCGKVDALCERVDQLVANVELHDVLINLHSHEGFATTGDVADCEERFVGMMEANNPPPPVEELPPPPPEPEEEQPKDSPPKSQKTKKSFADRYYGR